RRSRPLPRVPSPPPRRSSDLLPRRHAPLGQQHRQMIQQVGRLLKERMLGVVLGGDNDLGALLADLFQDLVQAFPEKVCGVRLLGDRKSTRLNSSHVKISYAVF